MSTLKVNKLRDTAGSADAITLDPNGGAVLAGVTTMTTARVTSGIVTNTFIVGAGVTISESGIEASGIGITCANINGAQISGRRNMIINGDQRVAQRGTTAVLVTTSAAYRCVDRWKSDIDGSSGGNWYHAQTGTGTTISADVPTGQGFSHSSKVTVNFAVSQPSGNSNRHQFYTQLEKQDVYHLEWGTSTAKTCTLSFWVKSSVTGTHIAYIRHYGGTTQSYYTNYTVDSANTWEKKIITLTGPTSGGNVAGTTDNGILIEFTLGASSGHETGTLREWTDSTTIRAAAGSVYLPENAGATWYVTGIQFEIGTQATPFEHRSYGDELSFCQRYYQGANTVGAGYGSANGYARAGCVYSVVMRSTPTLTTTNAGSGSIIATDTSATGFYVTYGSLGGSSAGIFNYVADAEL